jgi:cell division protein FtsW (lipid II flippase)
MTTGVSLGRTDDNRPGRTTDWIPLLIVLGAVYMLTASMVYGFSMWGSDDYRLESQISVVLQFVAATIFIVTIALVVYSREHEAKKWLIVGMTIVVLLLAIRTELYLRAL